MDNRVNRNNVRNRKRNTATGKRGVFKRNTIRNDKFREVDNIMSIRVPRNLMASAPIPPFQVRKLNFQYNAVVQAAAPFVLVEFRMNGAFSPDAVGTPAGFNEYAALYTLYQVTHFRFRYSVASNEPAVPVNFSWIFRDIQPSTIINTYAKAINAMEVAPTTGPNIVGETTGQSVYRSGWHKLMPAAVIGNAFSYFGNAAYGAATTANPTALVWADFVATSFSAGTNLTNGCFLSVYLELTTRFYSNAVVEL
jgi:hypothetical protein